MYTGVHMETKMNEANPVLNLGYLLITVLDVIIYPYRNCHGGSIIPELK